MKAVDPTIKIIAVGNNPLSDDPDTPASIWNEVVLRQIAPLIDYISWHIYQPEKTGWRENYDPLQLHLAVCAASLDIESILNRVEKQIHRLSPGRDILQAVDEWNLWLPPRVKNEGMHKTTYTMRDACYVTSVLTAFYRNCHTLGMANIAQMVNVLPLIQTNATSAIPTSIFFPFILFGQMNPIVLDCQVMSDTYSSQGLDDTLSAHENVNYLDGIATCSQEGNSLTLILVNRYPLDRMSVNIRVEPVSTWSPRQALKIQASSSEVFNSFQKPNRVQITDAKLPLPAGSEWQVTLAPSSVYFVEFTV